MSAGGGSSPSRRANRIVEPFLLEKKRHLVNGVIDVPRFDYCPEGGTLQNTGKLFAHLRAERMFGAANEHLRLKTDLAQFGDRIAGTVWFSAHPPP